MLFFQGNLDNCKDIYDSLGGKQPKPNYKVFEKAYYGMQKLVAEDEIQNLEYLVIIDFSLASSKKRLWVVNLQTQMIDFHSLVAHGKNSGNLFAEKFSNVKGSLQSSYGFYRTGETYIGKHGLSLYLDGLEEGINDKARERSIVMHGASYVSHEFIAKYGRLGRSFGCPAVPVSKHKAIINAIKGGNCLFIYSNNKEYWEKTQY